MSGESALGVKIKPALASYTVKDRRQNKDKAKATSKGVR